MEWLVLIIVVVLLLAAIGPRAGFYGTAGILWDLISLVLVIILIFWLLRLFGVLA
jgi:hypothetical protein